MLFPTTELTLLLVLGLSLVCWGSWIATYKVTSKWRFELYYYDFALGVLIAAVAAAYTLGFWNPRDLTFEDNYLLAGYRKMAWAIGSGIVFNLANLMLLASSTVSGLSVSFPIAFCLAWSTGAVWSYSTRTDVDGTLTFAGVTIMLLSGMVLVAAYRGHLEAAETKPVKVTRTDPRSKKAPPAATSGVFRGSMLAVLAGVLLSVFFPAMTEATTGDNGVSSYGAMLLAAGGIFTSTLLFVTFFLNFPVQGEPLEMRRYFRGTLAQHALGVLGGAIWTAGMLAVLVAEETEGLRVPAVAGYLLSHGGPLLAALLGILVWREFRGATLRIRLLLAATYVLFLAGLTLMALAPQFGQSPA